MQGEIASFKHCSEMGSKSSYIDIGFKEGRVGAGERGVVIGFSFRNICMDQIQNLSM